MSVEHYENFPVASVLCPARLRPAVRAIYWYARVADDLADEGDTPPEQRLADLADYRADLLAVARGDTPSPRWRPVFEALSPIIDTHRLPVALLDDLLSAFAQDVTQHAYEDRAELLDYCRRSANPVGRLLLHLYGVHDATALRQSDAICTALQLINFWQDLSVDIPRGRLYIPEADIQRHRLTPADVKTRATSAATQALLTDMAAWARALVVQGADLVHAVPGRAGWELRLVVQGGLRILDKIQASGFCNLTVRPQVSAWDMPTMLWRSLRMRPAKSVAATEGAR